MENWLLADIDALQNFYTKDFNPKVLPQNAIIEQVAKADVFNGLKRATQKTKKGSYHKGNHSFELLSKIDPQKVMAKAPHAQRLIAVLLDKSNK